MGVFTRDESELLSYDANAFWYFAGTMLTVIVIPWTILLVRSILRPSIAPEDDYETRGPGNVSEAVVKHCATAAMQAKRSRAIEVSMSWKQRLSGGVWFQIAIVAFLWVLYALVAWRVQNSTEELRSFDPYSILGIDIEASPKEIKKAYRTKSLQHHPDKDKDNPFAPVLFQQVAKAYAALTDDAARENYAKYGNPDGPGQMKVGVALHPVVLGTPENQRMTLCIFFSVLLIVPFSVVCCCLRGQQLSFRGVSHETLRVITASIDDDLSNEDGPSILAASMEARRAMSADLSHLARELIELYPQTLEKGLPVFVFDGPMKKKGVKLIARGQVSRRLDDKRAVEVETQEMKPGDKEPKIQLREFPKEHVEVCEPKIPCMFSDSPLRRNCMLIWSHLWRLHHKLQPAAQAELNRVLKHSVEIGRAMISIAANHPTHDTSTFLSIVKGLVEFRQCLVQALDIGGSPILQLPHSSEFNKKLMEKAPKFKDIVTGDANDFLEKLKLTTEQRLDVDAFCRHAPLIELSCEVQVTDEDEVAQGDIATLKITLTRKNLADGEAIGPVHAPFFPMPKFEEWWLLVYDERDRRLVTSTAITGTGREETASLQFLVPRSGEFRWTVHALCDSYAGLDVSHTFKFTALRSSDVKKPIFVHPWDRHIRTFFDELMEGLNPPVEESDSDSDEEEGSSSAKRVENGPSPQGVGAVAAAPPEDKKEVAERHEDCSDSDMEGCDVDHLEPEGVFFQVVEPSGAYIFREPRNEVELRIGSAPCGTMWRVQVSAEGVHPPGWAELGNGAWFNYADTEASMKKELQLLNQRALQKWAVDYDVPSDEIDKATEKKDPKAALINSILSKMSFDVDIGSEDSKSSTNGKRRTEPSIKQLGSLLEQPLRVIVQTRLPLPLLKRWMKKSTSTIAVEDMEEVMRIEEPRIRMLLDDLIRRRLGDDKVDTLMIQTEVKIRKAKQRILKARGFFCSAVGPDSRISWHVNPSGAVRGMHPDGSKIRDKVTVSEANEIRIGPFALDETRTCSCIHWHRKDDPERQWVWSRDRTLDARMRMNW